MLSGVLAAILLEREHSLEKRGLPLGCPLFLLLLATEIIANCACYFGDPDRNKS